MEFTTHQSDDADQPQGVEDAPSHAEPAEGETAAPFVIGGGGGDEVIGAGSSGRGIKSGTLLIIIVMAIAAIGLFSMRTISRVSAAVTNPAQFEKTVEAFLNGGTEEGGEEKRDVTQMLEHHRAILSILNEAYTERQVALDDLQRNPFILSRPKNAAVPDTTDTSNVDQNALALERKRAKRREELQTSSKRLKVQTILMGSNPIASINGDIVSVGDTIRSPREGYVYHVTEITPNAVHLEGRDPDLGVTVTIALLLKRL